MPFGITIEPDYQTEVIYIKLSPNKIEATAEPHPSIDVDVDADGNAVGITIRNVLDILRGHPIAI